MFALPELDKILAATASHPLEDAVDRLNYFVSLLLLVIFTIITGSKQTFGSPISCIVPPESHDTWSGYYHDFCYIKDKYLFSYNLTSSFDFKPKSEPILSYYQWVPYFFVAQMVMFFAPRAIWLAASNSFGSALDVVTVVEAAQAARSAVGDDRRAKMRGIAAFLSQSARNRGILGCSWNTMIMLVMKWWSFGNALLQMRLVTWFVARGNHFWAREIVENMLTVQYTESRYFPRVAVCQVDQAVLGNRQKHTLQCVMMFNFINEKIFLIFYAWIGFLAFVTALAALRHTIFVIFSYVRIRAVNRTVPPADVLFADSQQAPSNVRSLVKYFTLTTLGADGVLLLETLTHNVGRMVSRDIACELFKLSVLRDAPSRLSNGSSDLPSTVGTTKISSFPPLLTANDLMNGGKSTVDKQSLLPPQAPPLSLGRRQSHLPRPQHMAGVGWREKGGKSIEEDDNFDL